MVYVRERVSLNSMGPLLRGAQLLKGRCGRQSVIRTDGLSGSETVGNELCRGGPRDDPKADEACERRNVVEALLEKHGCKFVIYTKGLHREEWICRHKRKMK